MKLNELRDNPGARQSRKRVGRGIGSGLGKTSGVGQKGQKSRTGVAIKGFEGGQMPLYMRLPKRGFNNIFAKNVAELTLGRLQAAIDSGKLDASKKITQAELSASGAIRANADLVKVIATGEIKSKVDLEVHKASAASIEAVKKAKGSINLIETAAKADA